jgi:hypothetical protein
MLALVKMRAKAKAAAMVDAVQKVIRPIHESFFVLKVSPYQHGHRKWRAKKAQCCRTADKLLPLSDLLEMRLETLEPYVVWRREDFSGISVPST